MKNAWTELVLALASVVSRRSSALAMILLGGFGLTTAPSLANEPYQFRLLGRAANGLPGINNKGDVVDARVGFTTSFITEVWTSRGGGPLRLRGILHPDEYSSPASFEPAINDRGDVALHVFRSPHSAIVLVRGVFDVSATCNLGILLCATTLATADGGRGGGDFREIQYLAMNQLSDVAALVVPHDGPSSIFLWERGKPGIEIARASVDLFNFTGPSITEGSGTEGPVALVAFKAQQPSPDSVSVFVGNGTVLENWAPNGGGLQGNDLSPPSIAGNVVGATMAQGVFIANRGAVDVIVPGTPGAVFSGVSVNRYRELVFQSHRNCCGWSEGLFKGPTPADKVVRVGDNVSLVDVEPPGGILQGIVQRVLMSQYALNDLGQIAFAMTIDDLPMIVRADPPGSTFDFPKGHQLRNPNAFDLSITNGLGVVAPIYLNVLLGDEVNFERGPEAEDFAAVVVPQAIGDGSYDLYKFDDVIGDYVDSGFDLTPGVEFRFSDAGLFNVSKFSIRGIGHDGSAVPVGLTFVAGGFETVLHLRGVLTGSLIVETDGTGSGRVTSAPIGINCPPDCSQTYSVGIVVDLSATPSSDSVFAGFSGPADCTDGLISISESPTTCVATFDLDPGDTTPPDTSITLAPSPTTNSASADFEFTASEAGSTFECNLDSTGFTPCTSPLNYTGLADGAHSFLVRATDSEGNTDPTPASHAWTVDTTAPDTTITSAPPAQTNLATATFEFTANEPGSSFECRLDAVGFTPCTSPQMYSDLAEGAHNFLVRATDVAGNTDPTAAAHAWTISTTRALTVVLAGTGTGTVTSVPAGIDCPAGCAHDFPFETSVTLTPAAAANSTFTGWSGDPDCSDGVVLMDADKSCTANFSAGGPDLVVAVLASPPAAAVPGSRFQTSDTTRNQGGADARSTQTRFYLSPDLLRDPSDLLLSGAHAVPLLSAGAESTLTLQLTIPSATPLGLYYLLACADATSRVAESDETNNCLAAASTVLVSRPDLQMTALSGPGAASPGSSISVDDTVVNQGGTDARESRVRYYLSRDPLLRPFPVPVLSLDVARALAVSLRDSPGSPRIRAGRPQGISRPP